MINYWVDGIGASAYLMMNGWKITGRKGNRFQFEFEDDQLANFTKRHVEFFSTPFHSFGKCEEHLISTPDSQSKMETALEECRKWRMTDKEVEDLLT